MHDELVLIDQSHVQGDVAGIPKGSHHVRVPITRAAQPQLQLRGCRGCATGGVGASCRVERAGAPPVRGKGEPLPPSRLRPRPFDLLSACTEADFRRHGRKVPCPSPDRSRPGATSRPSRRRRSAGSRPCAPVRPTPAAASTSSTRPRPRRLGCATSSTPSLASTDSRAGWRCGARSTTRPWPPAATPTVWRTSWSWRPCTTGSRPARERTRATPRGRSGGDRRRGSSNVTRRWGAPACTLPRPAVISTRSTASWRRGHQRRPRRAGARGGSRCCSCATAACPLPRPPTTPSRSPRRCSTMAPTPTATGASGGRRTRWSGAPSAVSSATARAGR